MFNSINGSVKVGAKRLAMASVLFGLLSFGASAMAGEAAPGSHSKQVVLSDLDLSTEAGQRVAIERLHQSARTVCAQVSDELDLSHHANYVACVDDVMAKATANLQALLSRQSSKTLAQNQAK